MKKFTCILTALLALCLLAGCAGTPVVYYSDCTCPTEGGTTTLPATPALPVVTGGLKTGVSFVTSVADSTGASGDDRGVAKFDVSMVAVLVDEDGIIHDCVIDGIAASYSLGNVDGLDLTVGPKTKNELGELYGMVAYGGAVAEWDQQAASFAKFVIGKNISELNSGIIDESGHAVDADLASSATIYLGGFVQQIIQAGENAQYLGAQSGDQLKLAALTDISSTTAPTADSDGTVQLDVTITALTLAGDTITSCYLDGVQAKVSFNAQGAITSDLSAPATKNQLGESYGMKAWGGAIAEWNEQAAAFAAYVTGKTAGEVAGIAVDESTHPTEVDLASSVTIAIGGFQGLIEKACQP